MYNYGIIEGVANEVKDKMLGESSGHDWWHVWRVWKTAKAIAEIESADKMVVELSALLHDIADAKFHDGDQLIGGRVSRKILSEYDMDNEVIDRVVEIVDNISFKGHGIPNKIKSLEGKVVQDADRLDAIGAIGIARAFAYGGAKGKIIHDPEQKPIKYYSVESYYNNKSTTINHFYEKLLLIKDLMNTKTGKKMAEERHEYMFDFLIRFGTEWGENI